MSAFAVILKDPAAPLLGPAAFLAGVPGYTRDSALIFLRANPGFLGRNLPMEAARELSSAAAQAGFESMIVPETGLPALPVPVPVVKIEPKGEGFYARTSAASLFIPYESITVFSAAAYDAATAPDTVQALEPDLFTKIAALAGVPVPPPPAAARDTFFRAGIIGGEGPLRLLLKPQDMDFSALGPARSHSSLANFRAQLAGISGPASKAVKNDFLRAFLAAEPLAPRKVASPEAADLELARLLLLSAAPGA